MARRALQLRRFSFDHGKKRKKILKQSHAGHSLNRQVLASFLMMALVISVLGVQFGNKKLTNVSLHGSASEVKRVIPLDDNFFPFTDVNSQTDGFREIAYLKKIGVLNGYADGTFQPQKKVSKAEFFQSFANILRIRPHLISYNFCYPDVKNEWYSASICYFKAKGYLDFYQQLNFHPFDSLTLADALSFGTRYWGAEADNVFEEIISQQDHSSELLRVQLAKILVRVEQMHLN